MGLINPSASQLKFMGLEKIKFIELKIVLKLVLGNLTLYN